MTISETTEFLKNDMIRFLKEAPVVIPEKGLIAGFTLFDPERIAPPRLPRDMHLYDNLHFSMGTTFLKYGFKGVAKKARENAKNAEDEDCRESLAAIAEVYDAIADFIGRHADACDKAIKNANTKRAAELVRLKEDISVISAESPKTFRQAMQAFYFAWKLRGILNTSSMGRVDRYMWPFYKNDIENGIETPESALDYICDFWEQVNKVGSGDTLMNVTLGGCTPDGNDLTNDLSILMVKATQKVGKAEPHLNYRYHKNTRKDFLSEIYKLQLQGIAQGTMYNDEVIIPALMANGIEEKYAYDYTNDGCTEIIIDQKSTIFFDKFDIVKCFELAFYNGEPHKLPGPAVVGYWNKYLPAGEWTTTLETGIKTGDMAKAKSFDECYEMFKKQFEYQVRRVAKGLCDNYHRILSENVAPALLNGSFDETLETGKDTHRGGLPVECLNMFAGSIPTAADCLMALKDIVFDRKLYTIEEVRIACKADFEGYEDMRRYLLGAPKYGNDIDEVDAIAADIGNTFCDIVKEVGEENGLTIWPAFLGYLFVQEAFFTGATPDGRRWKDPICEHCSPTPGRAVNGPTAIMNSCGKLPFKRAFGTAPVQLSLSRSVLPVNDDGMKIVQMLNEVAVQKDFILLNIGVYDIEEMKDAVIHPELHEDIIVRVWGYSARFIDLSDEMQQHVMSRIINNG